MSSFNKAYESRCLPKVHMRPNDKSYSRQEVNAFVSSRVLWSFNGKNPFMHAYTQCCAECFNTSVNLIRRVAYVLVELGVKL